MSSKDIQQRLEDRFERDIQELGFSLRYVEWIKEGAEQYLRFFISSPEGISVDDCEKVSRFLDPLLDSEIDLNQEGYILEVSSPGIEAPLRKERDYVEAIDAWISVKLYQKLDGKKQFEGILKRFDPSSITLEINGIERTLNRDMISSARLAVQL